ncbi:MAG: hypothetical protein KF788_11780 [Piscinibacter sp.]|nr:hypothetical protein [Piscinibacter sp.]
MNSIAKLPPRYSAAAPAKPPALSGAERAELQRQGAKAAARGEPGDANPLGHARNQPSATGESADTWLQRSDAWDQGHEAQSTARRNEEPAASRHDVDEHD